MSGFFLIGIVIFILVTAGIQTFDQAQQASKKAAVLGVQNSRAIVENRMNCNRYNRQFDKLR